MTKEPPNIFNAIDYINNNLNEMIVSLTKHNVNGKYNKIINDYNTCLVELELCKLHALTVHDLVSECLDDLFGEGFFESSRKNR